MENDHLWRVFPIKHSECSISYVGLPEGIMDIFIYQPFMADYTGRFTIVVITS